MGGAWVVSREEDVQRSWNRGLVCIFVEVVCLELMLIVEKHGKTTDCGKDFISVKII